MAQNGRPFVFRFYLDDGRKTEREVADMLELFANVEAAREWLGKKPGRAVDLWGPNVARIPVYGGTEEDLAARGVKPIGPDELPQLGGGVPVEDDSAAEKLSSLSKSELLEEAAKVSAPAYKSWSKPKIVEAIKAKVAALNAPIS